MTPPRDETQPINLKLENIQIDIAVIKEKVSNLITRSELYTLLEQCRNQHDKMLTNARSDQLKSDVNLNRARAALYKAAIPLISALASAIAVYFSVR